MVELDHVFVCVARGAPEADRLVSMGFVEGPPNRHPGQGTANRRFFFRNAMLELLWVEDEAEARSPQTAPTRLAERWLHRQAGACPFGVILRPAGARAVQSPFASFWRYQPSWLPPGLEIQAARTGIDEPAWFYMPFLTAEGHAARFQEHPNAARTITRVTLQGPFGAAAVPAGIRDVDLEPSGEHLLAIELDRRLQTESLDLRPLLPVVFLR